MNWKSFAFAAALAVGLSGAVSAEESTGTITEVDLAALTVTLDDGQTCHFDVGSKDPDWNETLSDFKPGETVKIVWDTMQDRRVGMEMSGVHP